MNKHCISHVRESQELEARDEDTGFSTDRLRPTLLGARSLVLSRCLGFLACTQVSTLIFRELYGFGFIVVLNCSNIRFYFFRDLGVF